MRKMKRGIIAKMALGLFLLFVSMPLMAQEYRSDYLIRDGQVFYDYVPMETADFRTFRVLGKGYAKDSFRVYYCGRELADASASTFVYSGKGYGRDTFNTYFLGRKISD